MKTAKKQYKKEKLAMSNLQRKDGEQKHLLHGVWKKAIIFLALLTFPFYLLPCLDFNLSPGGFVFIPMGEGNTDPDSGNTIFGLGGGGEIGFEADLSTIWTNPKAKNSYGFLAGLGYTAGIEAAMLMNELQSEQAENISFYQTGVNIGLYFFPLSRLLVRADGAAGVYMFAGERGTSDPGLFLRGGGKLGFRFTPGFTLAANAGWRQFSSGGVVQNSGMYAGLTAQITFQAGRDTGEAVGATLDQFGSVYPAFVQLYQYNPIGDVVIRNNENAEIRDVRMFFRAANYTSSEFHCGSAAMIPRGRSIAMPLLADFSPDILLFTDTGRVVGELVIRYRFLGQEREAVRAVTIAVNNRNATPLSDPAELAAFISPTSPETLDFARFVAGLERANRRTWHNANMSYAMWLLEVLRASGLQVIEGRGNSYTQFPSETLLFRSGTSRDLALLAASCLEGVGIDSALISIGNEEGVESELLVAVSLGVSAGAAETLFNGTNKIFIVDNNVWLPLSLNLSEGFMACWERGAQILSSVFDAGERVGFITVKDAWASYPPAPLPELGRSTLRTDNTAVTNAVNRAVQLYITQEINPIIQRTQGEANSAAQQNRLGNLYARAGRIADAKAAYERAAGMGSAPAMANRGNLAFAENDYPAAERWFRQAISRDPENSAALRGLERIAGR
jgi:tetratricopeptide (TPR) repeat protein